MREVPGMLARFTGGGNPQSATGNLTKFVLNLGIHRDRQDLSILPTSIYPSYYLLACQRPCTVQYSLTSTTSSELTENEASGA